MIEGQAPHGQPRFVDRILSDLLDLKADGSFRLNLRYLDFIAGLRMTNEVLFNYSKTHRENQKQK